MLGRSSKRHTEQTAPGSNSNARPLPRRPNQNELSSGNDKVDGDRYACTTDSVDDDFIMVKESEVKPKPVNHSTREHSSSSIPPPPIVEIQPTTSDLMSLLTRLESRMSTMEHDRQIKSALNKDTSANPEALAVLRQQLNDLSEELHKAVERLETRQHDANESSRQVFQSIANESTKKISVLSEYVDAHFNGTSIQSMRDVEQALAASQCDQSISAQLKVFMNDIATRTKASFMFKVPADMQPECPYYSMPFYIYGQAFHMKVVRFRPAQSSSPTSRDVDILDVRLCMLKDEPVANRLDVEDLKVDADFTFAVIDQHSKQRLKHYDHNKMFSSKSRNWGWMKFAPFSDVLECKTGDGIQFAVEVEARLHTETSATVTCVVPSKEEEVGMLN